MDYGAMLCLSQTTGYAVRALVCLDEQGGHANLIRDIAKCAGIPKPYLARIINDLAHEGLVTAKRGYRGGVALAPPPGKSRCSRLWRPSKDRTGSPPVCSA